MSDIERDPEPPTFADLDIDDRVLKALSDVGPGLHVLPIYGGQSYGVQLSGLRRGAHVVVGTPGRVIDHLEKGTLDLSKLSYLVLDEADEMLKMGFQEDVERILADTPEYKQVALFSATMPGAIRKISKQYMHDPRERTIGQLKSGALDILVATDVAARGLDVDRISHVVNYDIPHDTESYVHRIGRTGRAGRAGEALLFVAPRERHLLKAIEKATRQPLAEMQLPSVDDVNAQRVSKFGDSITESLTSDNLALFRKMIEDYEQEHDVPLADIAAALAVQSRDGEAFLMSPEPPPPPRREREPRERPARRFDDGPPTRSRGPEGQELATYRIAVGKRHRVVPGAIVGAIANEGGLRRSDFGHISIRPDHSLVELPADLAPETLEALRRTRISGVLIQLQPDSGPPTGRPGRGGRDDRAGGKFQRDRDSRKRPRE
ncbi:MAG: DEAD/DEAH box helicase [Rhodococcus sp. (in: high G+C Gram-positive bacteria)]|nr:MAG: DEAD/DEAH box helicase [Rhodococcus sp. (in: high G+C Gram-positive bacteria)]